MNYAALIDAHVRHAIVGASAGAVLGSSASVHVAIAAACLGAVLMVWTGRKQALREANR